VAFTGIYISIDSLNRKTPWLLRIPSTPFGSRGKGSARGLATGVSVDLSVTSANPWALIESTSAGTISCVKCQLLFLWRVLAEDIPAGASNISGP
jgi:hypothetical protein